MNTVTARPLRFVGAHALRAIELRVLSALVSWAQDWLPRGAPEPALWVRPAGASAVQIRGDLHAADAGRLWIDRGADGDRALAAALFGAATDGASADHVFKAAFAEARRSRDRIVIEALIGTYGEPTYGAPDPHLRAFGSGAVQIDCDAIGLHLLADEGVLRHVPPRDVVGAALPPKVPLDRGLAVAPLGLEVTLGDVELPLGSLFGLGVGDVIRLPTRLDGHAVVSIAGRRLARGRLGMHDGHRAVQLVALGDTEKSR